MIEFLVKWWYDKKRKAPIPKVDAPELVIKVSLWTPPIPFADRIGIFYFFLFLLSRKARNVTTELPKVINKVNILKKTEIISKAVMLRTSLLLRRRTDYVSLGGYHPVIGTFLHRKSMQK